jgi:hypothetical protein
MVQTIVGVSCPKGVFVGISYLNYENDRAEEYKLFEEQQAGLYFKDGSVLPDEPKGHYFSGDGFAFIAQKDRAPEHKGINSLLSMKSNAQIRECLEKGFKDIKEFNKTRAAEKMGHLGAEVIKRGLEVIADEPLIEKSKVMMHENEFYDANYFLFVIDRKLYMIEPFGKATEADTVIISDRDNRVRLIAGMSGLIPSAALENPAIALCAYPNPKTPDSEKIDDNMAFYLVDKLTLTSAAHKLQQEIAHCKENDLPEEKIDLIKKIVFISDMTKNRFATEERSQFFDLLELHNANLPDGQVHLPTPGEIDRFS